MLPTITSLVIMIVEILLFRNVEANGTVTIEAYCIVEEPYPPEPVFKHVKEHIENCEKLGYIQRPEVKVLKDGIYYAFTFEAPQDFSVDTLKENKCIDYQDEEDDQLENRLNNLQNAKKEMKEREREYQQKIRDSESVWHDLGVKAQLDAYDKGMELSGSEKIGMIAMNDYASNHKRFYDPLLEKQKSFEEKKKWCDIAKLKLDAYIKKMEEEKELAEYRKFYDENGKDEQLGELVENYQEICETKEECIKDCIQVSSMPELAGLLDVANENLRNKKKLCAIAKNALDAYIKKMEEEKELAEYRKFYDENGKDEQLGELVENYQEICETKEKCIKDCIQMSSMPELAGLLEFANENLRNKKKLCAIAKNALDAYIKKMEEEKEKHKHFESVRTEKRKKAEEIIQNYEEKWSHSPKRGRGKIAKEGKEKKKKI
ncbi:hypothetical protein niasHT_035807 [Heterodera trifolii]|uniref:Uncharacterized protein n=1 Tax=Heterodera trifolii TaxID=157864 RepID=A0ABD2IYC5_9BILA